LCLVAIAPECSDIRPADVSMRVLIMTILSVEGSAWILSANIYIVTETKKQCLPC
jgi:hypothetical protein